jgi:hypothetical protein
MSSDRSLNLKSEQEAKPHSSEGRTHEMRLATRRVLAVPILLLGILLAAGSFVMLSQSQWGTFMEGLLWVALGLSGLPLGAGLLQVGRKLWRHSATELLANDARPPILILRSFSDDDLPVAARFRGNSTLSWTSSANLTLEELLAEVLGAYGPVIAIGRPGEKVPPLGAGRMYVTHQEWRQRVDDLLARCQVVVMIIGEIKGEDGVAWEFRRLLEVQPLKKVLLVFPPLPEEILEARWVEYMRLGGDRMPPYKPGVFFAEFDGKGDCKLWPPAREGNAPPCDGKSYRGFLDEFMFVSGREPWKKPVGPFNWGGRFIRALISGSILAGLLYGLCVVDIHPPLLDWRGIVGGFLLGALLGFASKRVG